MNRAICLDTYIQPEFIYGGSIVYRRGELYEYIKQSDHNITIYTDSKIFPKINLSMIIFGEYFMNIDTYRIKQIEQILI